jgi:peroxiredoxin
MANEHLKSRDTVPAKGEVAPDFELPDQDKTSWKLSSTLMDGPVALCFYPMAFTGVCSAEMKCLSHDTAKLKARGLQVVGISCDSWPALKAWSSAEHFTHPLLADMHRSVCRAYGLYWPDLNVAWRGTIIVGPDGKVLWSQKREIKQAMDLDQILAAIS